MASTVAGRAWVVVAGVTVALLAGCGADRTSPPSDLPARIAAACEPGASGTSQSRFVAAPGYPRAGQVGLVHDRATYRPGGLIVLVPVNRRRHNVSYGYPYSLERRVAGVWRRLPPTDGESFELPLEQLDRLIRTNVDHVAIRRDKCLTPVGEPASRIVRGRGAVQVAQAPQAASDAPGVNARSVPTWNCCRPLGIRPCTTRHGLFIGRFGRNALARQAAVGI